MYDRGKVRINILSAGRFHVLDLARELGSEGFDVKFYSYVPKPRCEKFGLQAGNCASYFWIAAPWILLDRGIRYVFPGFRFISNIRKILMDYYVGLSMRDCDILIAMSGEFVFSLKRAKKRGSLIIVERGSKHILEQKRILENIKPGGWTVQSGCKS